MAPQLASTMPELLDSCRTAIATLTDADRVLLLTSGPRTRDLGASSPRGSVVHQPGTVISSGPLTDSRLPPHFLRRLAGGHDDTAAERESRQDPGVGVIVGTALLAGSGIELPTTALELGEDFEVGRSGESAARVLAAARNSADRVAILLIAEGSASRGPDSPGGGQDGAEAFDAALAAALAEGSPLALALAAGTSASLPAALMFTSGPSLRALADVTRQRPPTHAELLFDAAPLGVGYFVAAWSWD